MSQPRLTSVARACDLLESWTGFEFRDAAPNRLADFLESRAATLGFTTVSEYLAELSRLPGDADEPQRLINLITNGLTAFWRDEPQLEALRAVMRDLARIRGDGSPLTIWCAGCATGEEAYTVAMVAREEQIQCSIVGSDINTDFLARASAGRYDAWSLRRLDPRRRSRWFTGVDHEQLQVSDALMEIVSFQRHNLQEPSPLPAQRVAWDVILCRNVLIYFGSEATERVLRHFAEAVDPEDGYLILGSSEHLSGRNERIFRASRAGEGFVYRSVDTAPGRSVPLDFATYSRETDTDVPTLSPGQSLEEETIEFGEDDAVLALIDAGRNHLQVERHETAIACFEAAAGYDPFVPEIYCLLGHVLDEAGAPLEALEAFQKALFLDPGQWYAAWRTARLAATVGDDSVSRRAYRQVIRLVEEGPRVSLGVRFVGDVLGDLGRVQNTALEDARASLQK